MRARTDPSFPSHTRFWHRLGSREQQVEAVRALAQMDEELAAVLPMLDPTSVETEAPGHAAQQARGFVYLVRSGKHHKIGYSNDVGRRSYEIALQLPEKLTLVHVLETDDPPGIESYWHRRFADRRVNGEWFLLTREDVAAFESRRKSM